VAGPRQRHNETSVKVCALTEHHAIRRTGEWSLAPRILDLGTRWR
jgi:hypothetical protein